MIKLWCIDKKAFERKIVLRQNQDCQERSGGRRQWEKESERNYMFQEANDMYFRMLSPLVWWNWNWWRRKDFFSLRKSTSLFWLINLCTTVSDQDQPQNSDTNTTSLTLDAYFRSFSGPEFIFGRCDLRADSALPEGERRVTGSISLRQKVRTK